MHGCQGATERLLKSGLKDQVVRKIDKNTQEYCLKFKNKGHLIMFQQGNSLHTEAVMQVFQDTEFSGDFFKVEC